MTSVLSPAENMRKRIGLLLNKDVASWVDQYAENAIHAFPFAPAGRPSRIEGRVAIADFMRRIPDFMNYEELSELSAYETSDGQTITAEFRLKGRMVATGAPFDMNYIWVITFRDEKIVRFHDYMNPLTLPQR
jgi:ketosteroid isomerase-like protein